MALSTYPCFCQFIVGVVVHNDIEDDQHRKVDVEGSEGHHAAKLALVHHIHECGKHKNFGNTVEGSFEQKKHLICSFQRIFLCPVSRKIFPIKMIHSISLDIYRIFKKAFEKEKKLIAIEKNCQLKKSVHSNPADGSMKAKMMLGSWNVVWKKN